MTGPTFLSADRVTLHPIEREDLDWIRETTNDRRVWLGALPPRPANGPHVESYFEDHLCDEESVCLLVRADDGRVGFVQLKNHRPEAGQAELGYWYHPDAWGNGYATEAARRLVEYGFSQRNLHRWTAKAVSSNPASIRVLEKVGFTEEGVHRKEWFVDGAYRDVHHFGLLRREWESGARKE